MKKLFRIDADKLIIEIYSDSFVTTYPVYQDQVKRRRK